MQKIKVKNETVQATVKFDLIEDSTVGRINKFIPIAKNNKLAKKKILRPLFQCHLS